MKSIFSIFLASGLVFISFFLCQINVFAGEETEYSLTNTQACYNGTVNRVPNMPECRDGRGYSANFRIRSVIRNNTNEDKTLIYRVIGDGNPAWGRNNFGVFDRYYAVRRHSTFDANYTVSVISCGTIIVLLADPDPDPIYKIPHGTVLVYGGYDFQAYQIRPCINSKLRR